MTDESRASALSHLITEANASGWAVTFNPGATPNCTVTQFIKCRREYVIAVGRGQSPDPLTALRTAWSRAQDAADLLESTTTPPAPAVNLLDLLGLSKPAVPIITRRI